MVAMVIVVIDELVDAGFEIAGQIVILDVTDALSGKPLSLGRRRRSANRCARISLTVSPIG